MAQQAEPGGNAKATAAAPVAIVSHDADAQATELFRRIYGRVARMMHPHHKEHEPGGKDALLLPFSALSDVEITTPAHGQVPVYNSSSLRWENNTASGLATAHGAFLYVPMPGTTTPPTVPPGPMNISGAARTITAIAFRSDGAVSATATGGSCTIGAGGGTSHTASLTTTWADDAALSVTITSCGADATYLLVDWNLT